MVTPDWAALRATRRDRPEAIAQAAAARTRRPLSSTLMLIAADHPARGALGRGDNPWAMADRQDLLHRLLVALERPGVDGVLGTADILEDLLLLGALEHKVVIGSMNRGGLQGSAFELDDRFTGYDATTLAAMGFNGGKMLLRIDPSDPATAATLEACGRAITQLAGQGLMAMIEPFMSGRTDGRLSNDLSAEQVIRSIAIASGLGATSAYTWLKLPVVDDMDRVMRATTMPTLLLGGDPQAELDRILSQWSRAVALPGVVGMIVGRTLLYPAQGDVATAVDRAVDMVRAARETPK